MELVKTEVDYALYGLRIWLTTIFIGPVLAFVLNMVCIAWGQPDNAFPFGLYLVLCGGYGMVLSSPALAAFMLIIVLLGRTGWQGIKFRLAVLFTALLLSWLTFWIISGERELHDIVHGTKLSLAYTLLICAAVFFYSPHRHVHEKA